MIQDLLFLYDRNLEYARKLVADVPDDQMVLQPAAGMNHPAWVLGHLAGVANVILPTCGQPPLFPPEWKALYGRDSKPLPDRARYASKQELVEALEWSHAKVKEALGSLDPKALAGPPPQPYAARFPTLAMLVIQMLTGHEQTHLGQLSAWRRVRGLPPV